MQFRKKPVTVEAMQVSPLGWLKDDSDPLAQFLGPDKRDTVWSRNWDTGNVYITTPEGRMKARPGDWVIRGVRGELYPCMPDVFETTYERVEDGSCACRLIRGSRAKPSTVDPAGCPIHAPKEKKP